MAKPASKPVDLEHLNGYTGGDDALNRQILGLFDSQCIEIIGKLSEFADHGETEAAAKKWRDVVHSLKGASRSVGAFELGDVAAQLEKISLSNHSQALEALQKLKVKAAQVHQFIDDLVKESA